MKVKKTYYDNGEVGYITVTDDIDITVERSDATIDREEVMEVDNDQFERLSEKPDTLELVQENGTVTLKAQKSKKDKAKKHQ